MTATFYNTGVVGLGSTASGAYYGTGLSTTNFWNTDYIDKKDNYRQHEESINIQNSARDSVLDTQISNLTSYIASGKEDKAMDAYNKLLEEMSQQTRYAGCTDAQLQAIARDIIEMELSEQAGEPVDLEQYIRDNTANASEQSRQKTLWCDDKVDSATEEDLLNAICGLDESKYISGGTHLVNGIINIFTLGGLTEGWDSLFGPKNH